MAFIIAYPDSMRTYATRDEAVTAGKTLRMPYPFEVYRLVYEGTVDPRPPAPAPDAKRPA